MNIYCQNDKLTILNDFPRIYLTPLIMTDTILIERRCLQNRCLNLKLIIDLRNLWTQF